MVLHTLGAFVWLTLLVLLFVPAFGLVSQKALPLAIGFLLCHGALFWYFRMRRTQNRMALNEADRFTIAALFLTSLLGAIFVHHPAVLAIAMISAPPLARFSFKSRVVFLAVGVIFQAFAILSLWKLPQALVFLAVQTIIQIFMIEIVNRLIDSFLTRRQLVEKQAELRSSQGLLTTLAAQAERSRIARDIHDIAGHKLTALSINLEVLETKAEGKDKEKLGQLLDLSKSVMQDVRNAVHHLELEGSLDIEKALIDLAENLSTESIKLQLEPVALTSSRKAGALLAVAQEAVTNAVRHAQSTAITISLNEKANCAELKIIDNGIGVDTTTANKGMGLKGMQDRMAAVEGKFQIHSTPGKGTKITAILPLRSTAKGENQ